jgi:hypothetical protein
MEVRNTIGPGSDGAQKKGGRSGTASNPQINPTIILQHQVDRKGSRRGEDERGHKMKVRIRW